MANEIYGPTQVSANTSIPFSLIYEEEEVEERCLPGEFIPSSSLSEIFNEQFSTLDSNIWFSWGSPLPYIQDGNLNPNGDPNYHSGVVSNGFTIPTNKEFKITFRTKQILNGSGYWNYIDIGITNKPGISSTTHGSPGWKILKIRIDGGYQNDRGPYTHGIYYSMPCININETTQDYDNDGAYHTYEMFYKPIGNGSAYFMIKKDGILKESIKDLTTSEPNFYLNIEGRSYSNGDGLVDWVTVETV